MVAHRGRGGNGRGSGNASDLGPGSDTDRRRFRCRGCARTMTGMASRTDASSVSTPAPRSGVVARLAAGWSGRWARAHGISLAHRFLLANLVVLLIAGLAVGVWVGDQLERSIVERTAAVTALYVESIVEPSVASMADGSDLTPEEIATLDMHLASSPLSDRVRSLRIW